MHAIILAAGTDLIGQPVVDQLQVPVLAGTAVVITAGLVLAGIKWGIPWTIGLLKKLAGR